jgi:hypothetical protein
VTWKPDYVDLAAIKGYLGIPVSDTADDVELQLWVTSASRAADRLCKRQFGQLAAPATRTYRGPAAYRPDLGLWVLEIDDLQDTTGFTVGGVAYATSGATLLPDNAPADGEPYTQLAFTSAPDCAWPGAPVSTVLAGRWGWSATPAQVPAAVRLQCARWNFRRQAPAGVAGSPDQGSEIRLLSKLDPDVAVTLTGLGRRRWPT